MLLSMKVATMAKDDLFLCEPIKGCVLIGLYYRLVYLELLKPAFWPRIKLD